MEVSGKLHTPAALPKIQNYFKLRNVTHVDGCLINGPKVVLNVLVIIDKSTYEIKTKLHIPKQLAVQKDYLDSGAFHINISVLENPGLLAASM
jgi:hypothetical protein